MLDRNSALAELRCATSGFETVLLKSLRKNSTIFNGYLNFLFSCTSKCTLFWIIGECTIDL